ncbi:MAG: HD domain-containing protein [Oscillospiraceae bacterium]|jgi:uncharacterized protein|nr:HD domain-containing protein [Oscillospiraceae bacterium]
MNKEMYERMENFMLSMMTDSAHDGMHVYRVLHAALTIAQTLENINTDILIAACLLHDIGREMQFKDPSLCHAAEGGKRAYNWLKENSWDDGDAVHIRDCITTHRFRGDNPPQSIEAKILFDADKLDAAGATGVARCLLAQSVFNEPLYFTDTDGAVITAGRDQPSSFFQEFNFKMRNIYDCFYTDCARAWAARRRDAAMDFYGRLLEEVTQSHQGRALLKDILASN